MDADAELRRWRGTRHGSVLTVLSGGVRCERRGAIWTSEGRIHRSTGADSPVFGKVDPWNVPIEPFQGLCATGSKHNCSATFEAGERKFLCVIR